MGQPAAAQRGSHQAQTEWRTDFFRGWDATDAELRAALKPLADLERLVNRVLAGYAQPRDLVAMRDTLSQLPNILNIVAQGETTASAKA